MDHSNNEQGPVLVLIASKYDMNDDQKCKNRRILSQVCATTALSLLIMDLGMMVAVTTIIIGELHNAKEGLSLDNYQCSWFGSIMLLCTPLGSVLSGCAQNVLGRKTSMLLVNVPHLIAWYMLYAAQSVETLYAASFLMGIGTGFLEAPTLSYIGETSEPRLRGTLATYANSNVVIGHLLEYLLGYLLPWRMAMLVSCAVPVVATVAIFMIPESPVWLLSRGKKDEAMSSLRWLRGWASVDEVSDEFRVLELYCQTSKNEFTDKWEANLKKSSGYIGVPADDNVTRRKPGFIVHVRDLLRPEILKPLQLVAVYFFFYHAASITAMRPYMIEVFYQLNVPLSPHVLAVISAGLQGAGALTCICLVRLVGKRTLSLVSMTCCTLCCLLLAVYAYSTRWYSVPTIPLLLLCTLYYFMNVGISPIPWLLISEVFPTRGRGVAGGLCAAFYYIFAFLVSKTWLNLHDLLELHGCFFLYGILGCFGVLYVFISLPETEGKTLADIEKYFARKK